MSSCCGPVCAAQPHSRLPRMPFGAQPSHNLPMDISVPRSRRPSHQPGLGPCCGFDPTVVEHHRIPPRWATWTARLALTAIVLVLFVLVIR